jgi:hypothetical protein
LNEAKSGNAKLSYRATYPDFASLNPGYGQRTAFAVSTSRALVVAVASVVPSFRSKV